MLDAVCLYTFTATARFICCQLRPLSKTFHGSAVGEGSDNLSEEWADSLRRQLQGTKPP
jgi:hypothetical protein